MRTCDSAPTDMALPLTTLQRARVVGGVARLALLGLVAATVWCADGAQRERDATPSPLEFERIEHRVEVGYYPRPFVLDFLFRVTGDAPVTIRNFSTSCPCTTVAMERTNYFPGQTGVITALYDYRGGETLEVQIVEVRTNRSARPQLLRIVPHRATVGLWAERDELRWLGGAHQRSQSFDVEIAPQSQERAPRVMVDGAGWTTTIAPLEPLGRYRVTVTPLEDHPPAAELIVRLADPAPETTSGATAEPADAGADPERTPEIRVRLVPAAK